jgi:signal transduction histidine kinase
MEILALYSSSEALPTAMAAGARHLAAAVDGFALIYQTDAGSDEPDGWAGFTCAKDATVAGEALASFREEAARSERPLRCDAPAEPQRIWSRAAGGIYGFPLRHDGHARGVAIIGCPGPWPRMRSAEFESTLRQITLVLDHHAVSTNAPDLHEPTEELLKLSEQLLAQDIELIKQDEKLEQVERLKSDLIEKMSHELGTPLQKISERVISVLATQHEQLGEAARQSLRESLDEAQQLMRTLTNILDLWRLKEKAVRVEIQDINLQDVVDEAIFNVSDRLRKGVLLQKKIHAPLPRVRSDVHKLNQIMFQVLDNAVKFTRRGHIELELSVEDGQLLCVVTDTGIGIASDDRNLIFDEFYQVDQAPTSQVPGAGLGLTLTKSLVELLGGAISLSSEIGQGTRFSFMIPVALAAQAPTS